MLVACEIFHSQYSLTMDITEVYGKVPDRIKESKKNVPVMAVITGI